MLDLWSEKLLMSSGAKSGLFVGVSGNNVVYSSDGKNWKTSTIPSGTYTKVSYGNGKFIALGDQSNSAAYSTNGKDWTVYTNNSVNMYYPLLSFAKDRFFATSIIGSRVYSFDGISWTQCTDSTPVGNIVYSPELKLFICYPATLMSAETSAFYSSDGNNWSSVTCPSISVSTCIASGKGTVVVLGSTGGVSAMYTTDGKTWTKVTIPSGLGEINVVYGKDKFVACTSNVDGIAMYSTDGKSWTTTKQPGNLAKSIAYGSNLYVTLCNQTNVYYFSSDGINWSSSTLPLSGTWSVAYGEKE